MSAFKRDVSIAVNADTKRDMAWRQNGRDMVAAEVEQMLTRRGSQGLPDAMPKTVKAAAAWILGVLIDPPAEDEGIRRVPAFGGFLWQTPYRDRAVHLARKFLTMQEADQAAVMAYARSGIKWRGDDVALLALLAGERGSQTPVSAAARRWWGFPPGPRCRPMIGRSVPCISPCRMRRSNE